MIVLRKWTWDRVLYTQLRHAATERGRSGTHMGARRDGEISVNPFLGRRGRIRFQPPTRRGLWRPRTWEPR